MRTRSFNLMGNIYEEPAVATITINGVQVYQGNLAGTPKDPDVYEEQELVSAGAYTLDDTNDVYVPVTVTLTSGQIDLGMLEWNYAYVAQPDTNPPIWVQKANAYNYGNDPDECECNRNNELINGEPVPDAGTNIPIMMHAGDVVTFNTLIFAGPKTT